MKIYTGTGDSGKTSLFSGERLRKNHIRVEAYGTIDELSSFIGAIIAHLPEKLRQNSQKEILVTVQKDLFVVGAIIATSAEGGNPAMAQNFSADRTQWLEKSIDSEQEALPELRSFILPGGHPAAAMAQVARTVCRRAERCIQSLADVDTIIHGDVVMSYINRLSDYMFVAARVINHAENITESTWEAGDAT